MSSVTEMKTPTKRRPMRSPYSSPYSTPRSAKRMKARGTSLISGGIRRKRSLILSSTKSKKKRFMGGSPFADSRMGSDIRSSPYASDRFIPSSQVANSDLQQYNFQASYRKRNTESKPQNQSTSALRFQDTLAKELFNGDTLNTKVLKFTKPPKPPKQNFHNKLSVIYSANKEARRVQRKSRYISSHPERILDAPEILDDYYINILDWSRNNILAVGLGPTVYLWNASSGDISMLMDTEDENNLITSLNWMPDGSHIAIGTADKEVQIWDADNSVAVRTMKGHLSRVGSLAWNRHILSSGSRDSTILNHDVRIATHVVSSFNYHQEEICGLTWSPDGSKLASGGNDNKCCIWELGLNEPKFAISDHKAAVKALAWSPHSRNLLATGAGTADRCIRFYNGNSGQLLRTTETNSQVCSLQWSKNSKELVSAHGFSQNQITIWQYPTMSKLTELTGHTARVLHTSMSPDGTTLCSAAADETLRFWKVFEPVTQQRRSSKEAREKRRNLSRSIR